MVLKKEPFLLRRSVAGWPFAEALTVASHVLALGLQLASRRSTIRPRDFQAAISPSAWHMASGLRANKTTFVLVVPLPEDGAS